MSDLFIHLGNEVVIRAREIIAIFDMELFSQSEINEEFLKETRKGALVVNIGEADTKSLVITEDAVYLSPFSALTLKRRSSQDANVY